jgi:monofunctional biosynthetic peptidoglycan transglycosylase
MTFGKAMRRLGVLAARSCLLFALISVPAVTALRWVDPPTSSFILQERVAGWLNGHPRPYVHHEWVDLSRIAPAVSLAVVAAEDQRFPTHRGFDLTEIRNALVDYERTGHARGASTISQQVAKNLFLWSDHSLIRKGLEAWFTLLIELTWSKRRILEVYLNLAQFGPDTYGVGAASWRYFYRPPAALTAREAALLASVLPNPERYRLDSPSAYVQRRAAWIRVQMQHLGMDYLRKL